MLFLKKFKAIGFKSFANPIEISFRDSMVGVVGPNGSGKSNIVDAIKWVLGEKSNKSLRGKISSDVIFHGSKDKDGSDYAQVSLTFDNKNRNINVDLDEVTVTRKLSRESANNEYFINNEPCRLKDIHEMFLDTGLARGSLGIISQGTVQWFVEAKPEERRKIFEDAAGIGLYAKRKEESKSELAKAIENLNRVSDYVNILGKDINKLSKQVEKAKIYTEKKQQLMELDLVILVKDIIFYRAKFDENRAKLNALQNNLSVNEPDLESIQKQIKFVKEKADKSDADLEIANNKLTDLIEKINQLEIKKSTIHSQLQNDLSSDNLSKKIDAYNQMIASYEFDLNDSQQNLNKINDELTGYESIKGDLSIKNENIVNQTNAFLSRLNDLRYQLQFIDEKINNEYVNEIGVKTIVENKSILPGISGVVKDFIQVEPKYEKAIEVALGKTANFVVVDNEDNAKYAIEFLKKNKSGKATFIPLTMVKPKTIREEHNLILQQLEGYIDTANKLIIYDAKYDNLFSSFLGRTIISDDLNSAIIISKYTHTNYPVISIEGEIISTGGAITGGYNKQKIGSLFNLQEKKSEIEAELNKSNENYSHSKLELVKISSNLEDINLKINEKKILASKYNEKISNAENNLYRYKTELEQLKYSSNKHSDINNISNVNDVDRELAMLYTKKDKIIEELNIARQSKLNNREIYDDYLARLEETRELIDKIRIDLTTYETNQIKCENVMFNAKERLAKDYNMTIDYAVENFNKELSISDAQARETIYQLRADINKLGGINMEALDELESKQVEFNDLSKQQAQLIEAKEKIEQAIAELNNKAEENFRTTINKVNEQLPYVFKYLFGGGNCTIQYTDPENILSSGIDVVANPPGKKIVNLNLLSGGEKTLVALSVLFSILQIHSFPLIILDEAESALDPANVERFGNIIHDNSNKTQFLIITHRPGTMERCDSLFGATMQFKGITSLYNVSLKQAKQYGEDK